MSQQDVSDKSNNPLFQVLKGTPKRLERWLRELPPDQLNELEKKLTLINTLSTKQLEQYQQLEESFEVFVNDLINKGVPKEQIDLFCEAFQKKPKKITNRSITPPSPTIKKQPSK